MEPLCLFQDGCFTSHVFAPPTTPTAAVRHLDRLMLQVAFPDVPMVSKTARKVVSKGSLRDGIED
jgi:hypothetical protein